MEFGVWCIFSHSCTTKHNKQQTERKHLVVNFVCVFYSFLRQPPAWYRRGAAFTFACWLVVRHAKIRLLTSASGMSWRPTWMEVAHENLIIYAALCVDRWCKVTCCFKPCKMFEYSRNVQGKKQRLQQLAAANKLSIGQRIAQPQLLKVN